MRKVFIAPVLFAIFGSISLKISGDFTCTVKVKYNGEIVVSTATSDVSNADACKKTYALAMEN